MNVHSLSNRVQFRGLHAVSRSTGILPVWLTDILSVVYFCLRWQATRVRNAGSRQAAANYRLAACAPQTNQLYFERWTLSVGRWTFSR